MANKSNRSSNPDQKRICIGFIYLLLFFISLTMLFFLCKLVFWDNIDSWNWPKVFGRAFFVLSFSLLGISFRAFKWSTIGTVPPCRAYFLEYPIIVIVSSVFIFSLSSSIPIVGESFLFYTFSAPLSIVAGFSGYDALRLVNLK